MYSNINKFAHPLTQNAVNSTKTRTDDAKYNQITEPKSQGLKSWCDKFLFDPPLLSYNWPVVTSASTYMKKSTVYKKLNTGQLAI